MSKLTLYRILLALYWITLFAATHWPRTRLPFGQEWVLSPDKLIHVAVFGILMHLALIAKLAPKHWHILLIISAYACFDEITQAFVPMRTVDWYDLLANLIGIGSVSLAWGLVMHFKSPTIAHD